MSPTQGSAVLARPAPAAAGREDGLACHVRHCLSGEVIAVALYGSHAQGTAGPASDIDVLQVTPADPRSYSAGPINVTAYTPSALLDMARRGSLFVLHLRQDARVLQDDGGVLAAALDDYRAPRSYAPLYAELRAAAVALHEVPDSRTYVTGLGKLGVYLLRTAMYARLADSGEPEFVLSRAVHRLGRRRLLTRGLAVRHKATPGVGDLRALLAGIDWLIGPVPANRSRSVESLAVRLASERPYAADLLAHALAGGDGGLTYTALTPPALL